MSNKEIESNADGNGKNFTPTLTITEIIVLQLQQVLTSVESKLDGVIEKVKRLETALNGVLSDITALQSKRTQLKKATDDNKEPDKLYFVGHFISM